jgi:hypothetical protein
VGAHPVPQGDISEKFNVRGRCAVGTQPPATALSASAPSVCVVSFSVIVHSFTYHIQSASDSITIFLVIVFRVINKFSVCFTRRIGKVIHNVCNAMAGLWRRDGGAGWRFLWKSGNLQNLTKSMEDLPDLLKYAENSGDFYELITKDGHFPSPECNFAAAEYSSFVAEYSFAVKKYNFAAAEYGFAAAKCKFSTADYNFNAAGYQFGTVVSKHFLKVVLLLSGVRAELVRNGARSPPYGYVLTDAYFG